MNLCTMLGVSELVYESGYSVGWLEDSRPQD